MAVAGVTMTEVTGLVAQVGGLAILAGTLAAVVAGLYRWYAGEEVPRGLGLLAGLGGVALYLNTTSALAEVISRQGGPTETQVALFNIAAFTVAAGGAEVGRRVGDRFESDVFLGGDRGTDDVGRLGRALGRVREVRLPEEIEDVVGYDPVEERTREALEGETFVFPRGLGAEELEARLVARLKTDYGVGTVDVDVAADGTVAHLGVGRRAAGIGPTLPPATNAVAVRADPPFAASAGDLVQLWETDPARRVLTGELRGVAEDVVTLAIDAADTPKVDPHTEYRLVTLPVEDRPDREFASLLRAADETYTSVAVEAGSPLAGAPVGALSVAVVALADEAGETATLPPREAVIEPGTTLFAVGTPDRLRRLEAAATALPPGTASTSPPASTTGVAGAPGTAESGTSGPAGTGEAPPTAPAGATDEAAGEDREETTGAGETTPPTFDDLAEADEEATADADDLEDLADSTAEEAAGDAAGFEDLAFGEAEEQSEADTGDGDEGRVEDDRVEDGVPGEGATTDQDGDAEVESDEGEEGGDGEEGSVDGRGTGAQLSDDDDSDDSDASGDDSDASGDDSDARDEDNDDGDPAEEDEEDDDDDGAPAEEDDDEDGEDGDESGGSDGNDGSTFAQLKAEFESGDPDWADEISDSPGGDMRLDE